MAILPELKSQIFDYIKQPIPQNENMKIVERSVPVPFFGNIETAHVATISINPSNCEFVDEEQHLFCTPQKRFVDRDELGINDIDLLNDMQANLVYESMLNYFKNKNSYKKWFDMLQKRLGSILGGSYYDGTMVNFDIYPWATEKKWKDISAKQKSNAMQRYTLLKDILLKKDFKYVYINGITVKDQIAEYFKGVIKEYEFSLQDGIWKIYEGKLENRTHLIGLSCYIPSRPIKKESLDYLLNELKQYM